MQLELFIALRYLLARRKQAFISIISFISTLGVAVGVAALIIALALMTGLQGELRDRMLGSMPHIYVARIAESGVADVAGERARLLPIPHVVGAAPVTRQFPPARQVTSVAWAPKGPPVSVVAHVQAPPCQMAKLSPPAARQKSRPVHATLSTIGVVDPACHRPVTPTHTAVRPAATAMHQSTAGHDTSPPSTPSRRSGHGRAAPGRR